MNGTSILAQAPAEELTPALAPDVRLVGPLQGSGFQHPQWLVMQDGRFIQMTELLYRLAEQLDGRRTLQEVADRLTETTNWNVDTTAVQHLITHKLAPLGLVADSTASPAGLDSSPRSPLALYGRVKIINGTLIGALAGLFQNLFRWPLLLPLVVMIAVSHWWLYRVHGVMASVSDAVATPGGLLVVLAIIFIAAFFHEVGHASALHYSGGRVRSMGLGLYLMYPAFYTDVTDSYRLGRGGRIRTDLGGIYFHLVFAVLLIALFAVTKRELLLFAVILINLEVLRQFIPFVRLDGYWMIADLTGIPDLFSQMVPFVRSYLHPSLLSGVRLPALKPWVRVAFVIYIAATVPVLLFLLSMMINGLPLFLSTTAEVLGAQSSALVAAYSKGSWGILSLLVIQIVVLILPVVGTVATIYLALHLPVRLSYRWFRSGRTRRIVGILCAGGALAIISVVWSPKINAIIKAHSRPSSIEQASRILSETRQTTANLHTLTADVEGSLGRDRFTGTVKLQRPNFARIEINDGGELSGFSVISDGTNVRTYFPAENRYVQSACARDGSNISAIIIAQVEGFFRPNTIGAIARGEPPNVLDEYSDGVRYRALSVTRPGPPHMLTRYFISPGDKLVHRVVTFTTYKDGRIGTSWVQLKNVRRDSSIDPIAFKLVSMPSAKPLQMPDGFALPQ
jgi:hypothetical protein